MSDHMEDIWRWQDWLLAKAYLQRIIASYHGDVPAFEVMSKKVEEIIEWIEQESPIA